MEYPKKVVDLPAELPSSCHPTTKGWQESVEIHAKRPGAEQQAALASIHRDRASFDEAVKQAQGAGSAYRQEFVAEVLQAFDKIESALDSASESEIEGLVDRAESLSRLRAYVYPPEELMLQGKSALADMSEWSVPPTVLKSLQDDVLLVVSGPEIAAARAGLYMLFEDYDYWNWYVDWYDDFMSRTALWLVGLLVLLLLGAVASFHYQQVVLGLICAGGCGALVSVLSKIPPLSIYGEAASYRLLIRRRLGVGLAASVIGSGFLASGIITIAFPNDTNLKQVIAACAATPTTTPAASPSASSAGCTTDNMLILLALAMILGFSERGLTSLEDKIFPSSTKGPPTTTPPPGPPAGAGAGGRSGPATRAGSGPRG